MTTSVWCRWSLPEVLMGSERELPVVVEVASLVDHTLPNEDSRSERLEN